MISVSIAVPFYPTVICLYACNYTIGAFQVAATASGAAGHNLKLIENVPQYGTSSSGSAAVAAPMFYTYVPTLPGGAVPRPGLSFLLTPSSGSARLYINAQQTGQTAQFPDSAVPSSYTYSSPVGSSSGSSSLVLDGSVVAAWPLNTNVFYIAVYPDVPSTTFTVSSSLKCVCNSFFFLSYRPLMCIPQLGVLPIAAATRPRHCNSRRRLWTR